MIDWLINSFIHSFMHSLIHFEESMAKIEKKKNLEYSQKDFIYL